MNYVYELFKLAEIVTIIYLLGTPYQILAAP